MVSDFSSRFLFRVKSDNNCRFFCFCQDIALQLDNFFLLLTREWGDAVETRRRYVYLFVCLCTVPFTTVVFFLLTRP
jgi:hypothetical protein